MYYILENKTPKAVDLMEWAKWFETADRIVKSDMIDGVHVSTVFLGLDHGMPFNNSRPLLFETMIFGGENDQYQASSSTWREAEMEHQKAMNIINGTNIINQLL